MEPFTPNRRRYYPRKRMLTYKNLFLGMVIVFMSYAWYVTCDDVNTNKQKVEVSECQ